MTADRTDGRPKVPPALRTLLRSASGRAGLLGIALLVALAVFGPIIWQEQANTVNTAIAGAGPSGAHPFGTDALGRDLLARTFSATRLSLELAAVAALIAVVGGTLVGLVAASMGRARQIGARGIDAMLGLPDILIAIYLVTILGAGAMLAAVAVGISGIPFFARVTLSLSASITARDYVSAAQALGVPTRTVLRRHVLPNIAETLIVSTVAGLTTALIAVSSLSFLGLGVQPPSYDWGALLTQGIQTIYETPVAALAPAAMIALTGVVLGLFSDAVAEALNPRLWTELKEARKLRFGGRRLHRIVARARGAASPAERPAEALVSVRGLTVSFPARGGGEVAAVAGVDLAIAAGEIVGVVGESGSGKSLTAQAIGLLIPHPGRVAADELRFAGHDMLDPSGRPDRVYKGALSYVFQDPSASLNPALRLERQMAEAMPPTARGRRRDAAVSALREVEIAAPERRVRQYPHELSGGMRQRVMIAMGLLGRPRLIVADEPTTALDVTIQAQVLHLLAELNRTHGTAILLISHSLGVIAQISHRVVVMYAGRVVEEGSVADVLQAPAHPYSRALIAAVPTLTTDTGAPLTTIDGAPPAPGEITVGCPFAPRCPLAIARCREEMPPLEEHATGHRAACWVTAGRSEAEAAA
ncbi:MAG TPA: dipeptide/oligopeptide/nickel ABC transporter permease/ATP-binding protein [Conexibacter sp.]|nr:dipeptide/oligopeptide/nickel ABC transporter permease/ATP-binding protein [Conexibacter sp.]